MSFMNKMRDYLFSDAEGADDGYFDDTLQTESKETAASVDRYTDEPAEAPAPRRGGKIVNIPGGASSNMTGLNGSGGSMKMILFTPTKYNDATMITDNLKAKKPVIVNMVDLDKPTSLRILDFLSGTVYALNGTMCKVSYGIFLIVPSNVTVVGNNGVTEEKLAADIDEDKNRDKELFNS